MFYSVKLLKCLTTAGSHLEHRIEINRKATQVGTFEVCVPKDVALCMIIMQALTSRLPFLANRNAELTVPPLFCQLRKNRGTCSTAEWPYCLFPLLCLELRSGLQCPKSQLILGLVYMILD